MGRQATSCILPQPLPYPSLPYSTPPFSTLPSTIATSASANPTLALTFTKLPHDHHPPQSQPHPSIRPSHPTPTPQTPIYILPQPSTHRPPTLTTFPPPSILPVNPPPPSPLPLTTLNPIHPTLTLAKSRSRLHLIPWHKSDKPTPPEEKVP